MHTQKFDAKEITVSLVTELITQQFPQWGHLPIRPVEHGGHDNRTFHLGDTMSIRMPSAECYALKVEKEQKWLRILAPQLTLAIPEPLAMGRPSKSYPWSWSVYKWIPGRSANTFQLYELNLPHIAIQIAQFLQELHKIDTTDELLPGQHNFWRGASPKIYDAETRSAIDQLQDVIDANTATAVWDKALSSIWHEKPVWIHGDLSTGNMLVKDGQLIAVIDFGGMGVGDPACDLVIAWTFFTQESREIFKSEVKLDPSTWARARGWALWKALVTLVPLIDRMSLEAQQQRHIINEILKEHNAES